MLLRSLVLSALALTLSACNLAGTGEKGPFKINSDVTLSKLDTQANLIVSESLSTQVYSNDGAYSFTKIRWNGWAQLQISGQYFNEFTANTNADVITLDAITKKDRKFDSANVHIFSHLAAGRIKQRVANGQSRLKAWRDTQTEMKQLFDLKKVSRNIHRGVEQLSLLKGSGQYRKDNANLLLFTGSFLAVGGDSASLELLTTDFADDGQFNGVGTALFNSIAVMGATDGLLGDLSSNLINYGIGNPPNDADMPSLPTWVNQDTTDDVAPDVTVNGQNPITIVVGTSYVDEGASATDNVDGEVAVVAINDSDVIDTSAIGSFIVTYNATDIAGNTGSATRDVEVVEAPDTEAPVIVLEGGNSQTVEVDTSEVPAPYQEPGYTVTDNRDNDLNVEVLGSVQTDVLGTYILTYSALDTAGNDVIIDRTVEVVDTTNPVITLNGANTIDVVAGIAYEDEGATATDNYYGVIDVVVSGAVDIETVGTYTLTYTAEDGSNNIATKTRTVTVTEAPDTTAPVITLQGNASVTVEAGTSYADAGATALDNKDGDLTGSIVVGGSVNVNVPATYTLTYNVQDSATNAAVEVTRNVIVRDTIAPIIILIGESTISLVEGSSYIDAGATASDNLDGDITANLIKGGDTVDSTTTGEYTITYNVMDNAQNLAAQVTRTVTITEAPDTTLPVITLQGDASMTVEAGTSYTDVGATALDNKDGDLTGAIVVGGSVNVNVPATYTLTYNVQDSATNAAVEVTRTVIVSDTIAPVITLIGDATLVIQKSASYSDAGATASDSLDGDITGSILVGNSVNTSTPATYIITYDVSDGAGNPADRVTRSVRVNAPPTAHAGTDISVETGNIVNLLGNGSDTDGTGVVTYQWKRGNDVLATSASFSYTPENSETLSLVVTDSDGAITTDTINIEVTLPADYQIVFITNTTTVPRNIDANLFVQGVEALASVVDGSGNPVATEPIFDVSVVDLSTPGTYPLVFSFTDPYDRTITKTLSVIVENYAPVATSDSVTVDEDSTNNPITLVASDANQGDTLNYTVTQPASGTIAGNAPNVTYTPAPNFAGSDSFTFKVDDGIAESTGTISITVTDIAEPNTAPVAVPQTVTVDEDSTDNVITLVGTDTEVGDTLTFTITTPPTNGALGGSGQNITYTPSQDFFGTDSFTFTVSDGTDSSTATVSITVTDVAEPNQAPVANARLATVDEDSVNNSILLSGIDPDGDDGALTYAITTQPTHGSLSGTAPDIRYTPASNYHGTDEFYFTVNDGVTTSSPAKVFITVTSLNDLPTADAGSDISVRRGEIITLNGSGADQDGTITGYRWTGIGVDANYEYATTASFDLDSGNLILGDIYLQLTVTDNNNDTASDQIKLTILPALSDPAEITFNFETPLVIETGVYADRSAFYEYLETQIIVLDQDGNPHNDEDYQFEFEGYSGPAGTDIYDDEDLWDSFDPTTAGIGLVSINYLNEFGDGIYDVELDVVINQHQNSTPVANTQGLITVAEDSENNAITLTGTDADGDSLSYEIDSNPANGSITGTGQNFTYTPDEDYSGADSFTFTVSDGTISSTPTTINIMVTDDQNHAPVATPQAVITVVENSTDNIVTLTGTDEDNDPLTYDIDSYPANGSITGTGQNYTYTPDEDYFGADSFSFTVNDGDDTSTPVTISIMVTEVPNNAPVANTQALITVAEDSSDNAITLTGSDADGDPLTYEIASYPENGSLSGSGQNYVYTPDEDYSGSDSFSFTVHDGDNGSAPATINIMVTDDQNHAPVANTQALISVEKNSSLTAITITGTDEDGDPLTYEIDSYPENGSFNGSGQNYTYTPDENYIGADSFSFTVNDGDDTSIPVTVNITVTEPNIASTCRATPTTEAAFTDTFIALESTDVPWPDDLNNVLLTVDDIANVFNSTRASTDPFELQGKQLVMPTQAVWDTYTDSQKALFLINSERCARGILPYEGISPLIETSPAQYYADYLSTNNVFGHEEDGSTPWERLSQLAGVVRPSEGPANADFFAYAENLALNSLGSSSSQPIVHEPVAKAIYAWMYNDKESTKVNTAEPPAVNYIYTYGHRKFILAKGLLENSGEANKEGLIGIGVSTVQEDIDGINWTKVYTVMNAFDPNENWPLDNIQTVDLLESNSCLDGYRPVGGSYPVVCEQVFNVQGEFYKYGRFGPYRYNGDVLLEVFAILPDGSSTLVYEEDIYNQNFSINFDLSDLNEATEILIIAYSPDTYDEIGRDNVDLVDGQTVYGIGNFYLDDELPIPE